MTCIRVFVLSVDVICSDNTEVQRSVSEALTSRCKSLSIITGFSFASEPELMCTAAAFLNEVPGWFLWTGVFFPVTALLLLLIAVLGWKLRESKTPVNLDAQHIHYLRGIAIIAEVRGQKCMYITSL